MLTVKDEFLSHCVIYFPDSDKFRYGSIDILNRWHENLFRKRKREPFVLVFPCPKMKNEEFLSMIGEIDAEISKSEIYIGDTITDKDGIALTIFEILKKYSKKHVVKYIRKKSSGYSSYMLTGYLDELKIKAETYFVNAKNLIHILINIDLIADKNNPEKTGALAREDKAADYVELQYEIFDYLDNKEKTCWTLANTYMMFYNFIYDVIFETDPDDDIESIINISSVISDKIKTKWLGRSACCMKIPDNNGNILKGIINSDSFNESEYFEKIKAYRDRKENLIDIEYGDMTWFGKNSPDKDTIEKILCELADIYEITSFPILWQAYLNKGKFCIRYMMPLVGNPKLNRKNKKWLHYKFRQQITEKFSEQK